MPGFGFRGMGGGNMAGGFGAGLRGIGQRMQGVLHNARGAPGVARQAAPAGGPMAAANPPATSTSVPTSTAPIGPADSSGMTYPTPSANTPSSGGGMGGRGSYAKGGSVKSTCYAQGGPVTGRTRSFVKGDDEFRTGKGVPQNYGKKGAKDSV